MSRPVVWKCDGCSTEERTADFGLPDGWVKVTAHVRKLDRAAGEGEFCRECARVVDVFALAETGRLWNPPKDSKRTAAKGSRKVTDGDQILDLDEGNSQ